MGYLEMLLVVGGRLAGLQRVQLGLAASVRQRLEHSQVNVVVAAHVRLDEVVGAGHHLRLVVQRLHVRVALARLLLNLWLQLLKQNINVLLKNDPIFSLVDL